MTDPGAGYPASARSLLSSDVVVSPDRALPRPHRRGNQLGRVARLSAGEIPRGVAYLEGGDVTAAGE